MAKQLVNPIERHVEKAVLAVAALLLIAVFVKFVFSSPNKVELGSEQVTPRNIDARLAQKAAEIVERIRNARPAETSHDPLFDDFVKASATVTGDPLPLSVAMGPPVPLIDSPEAVVGRATLVKIPRPGKPAATFGRNTLLVANSDGTTSRVPVNWVTVAVVQDVKALSELQRRNWGATKTDVVFVPPEMERRMRRPDGRWSDDDWTSVTPWPATRLPAPPNIQMVRDGGKVVISRDEQKRIAKYEEEIGEPQVQLSVIRPLPPELVRDGHPWRFPILTTYDDILKQDDEFLHPKEPASASPEDRYGLKQPDAAKPTRTTPQTPAELLAQELDNARRQLEDARRSRSKNDATIVYNIALGISTNKDVTPDLKQKAERLQQEANLLIQDIQHEETRGRGRGPATEPAGPASTAAVREKMPKQQIWAHDFAADSVASGATYQYRIRVRILNRLAGSPESFENPDDAAVYFIASEWSDPTDPITIPDDSLFFVTRDDPKRREITVEFFRWYDGVWIKSSAARFTEGQSLVHETRTPVPGIQDRNVADTPLVSFSADATLLDVDFARPHRERKAGSGSSGVRFTPPENSVAAVFVDSRGRLFERIVAMDKSHPDKRAIKVYTPSRP